MHFAHPLLKSSCDFPPLQDYTVIMKLKAICFFLFILLFSAAAEEKIRVILDDNYPPYSFRNEDGELVGISVDQWKEWEKTTGIRADLTGMTWDSALVKMDMGLVDVIDTIFMTKDRETRYFFTDTYAEIEVAVFVHKSILGITNSAGLKGLSVAVKKGDSSIPILQSLGITDFVRYDDYNEIITGANRLNFRVFCMDKPPAIFMMSRTGIYNKFYQSFTLYTGQLRRAVSKSNPKLYSEVQEGFKAIRPARYLEIERNWLGSSTSFSRPKNYTSILILSVLCFFIVVAGFLLFLLRRNIRRKNVELNTHVHRFEASEKRNKAIMQAIPDLYFIIDRNGKYLDYNATEMNILKIIPKGLIGATVSDFFSPDDTRRIMAAIHQVLADGDLNVIEYQLDVPVGLCDFESRIVALDGEKVLFCARDITKRMAHEEDMLRSLHEKEVLLREIHHRVKNNLQVISSLISLQVDRFVDDHDRSLMQETQHRIQSMAQLHEFLYQSDDFLSINIREYLSQIVDELIVAWARVSDHIHIIKNIEDLHVSLEIALPIGLIVNELISNSLKYAFVGKDEGTLDLSLVLEGDAVILCARDDGCGLPEGVRIADAVSLGMVLIRSLTQQLKGQISVLSEEGTAIQILFPKAILSNSKKTS